MIRLIFLLPGLGASTSFGEMPEGVEDFLDYHCFECHDGATEKGGLNLEDLPWGSGETGDLAMWTRVFDRVESGEMPPAKKERPKEGEKAELLAALTGVLVAKEKGRYAREGRTVARRLNGTEYEATLRDLLALSRLEVKAMLPADAEAHGFDNVAEAHRLSYVQIERYLAVGRHALEEAAWFAPELEKFETRIPFKELRRFQITNDVLKKRERPVLLRQPNTAQTPWLVAGFGYSFSRELYFSSAGAGGEV